MRWLRGRLTTSCREDGVAMITVIMFIAVIGALGATLTAMSVNNTRNTTFDRQAGSALNVSEGGVAAAVGWIRYNGVGQLSCSTSTTVCSGLDWGNSSSPHIWTSPSGAKYKVWIETVQAYNPPAVKSGLYTVHSVGLAGGGPAARSIAVDVQVAPLQFPIGVFAHTVQAGGNGGIHYESLFSDSCVQGRQFETFQGTDAYYGIPAGVHSANYIVPKQNDACTASNDIHNGAACNSSYPYDTDLAGGPLTAADTACYNVATFNGLPWLTTSAETSATAMASFYGYQRQTLGLSNSQLDALRTAAQQQGFYFTNTTAIPAVLNSSTAYQTYPHPVLFYDLANGNSLAPVDLKDLGGYSRSYPVAAGAAGCTSYGAIVIVLNGNVKLNGGTVLVASVFAPGPAPYGQVSKANGTGQLIGTLYADNVDQRGTSDVYLDSCFLANLPGGLLNVTESNFREIDR